MNTQTPNIVVCAYHNVGCRCIEELLRQGAEIALVFTHEDSPTEQIWFDSVRALCEREGIPFVTSDINEPENVERVRAIAPDFILSFYYRNMIKPVVLDIPKRGALNLHATKKNIPTTVAPWRSSSSCGTIIFSRM